MPHSSTKKTRKGSDGNVIYDQEWTKRTLRESPDGKSWKNLNLPFYVRRRFQEYKEGGDDSEIQSEFSSEDEI